MKMKQKEICPSMLLDKLGASLLGNILTGKGFIWAGEETTSPNVWGIIRADKLAAAISCRQRQDF